MHTYHKIQTGKYGCNLNAYSVLRIYFVCFSKPGMPINADTTAAASCSCGRRLNGASPPLRPFQRHHHHRCRRRRRLHHAPRDVATLVQGRGLPLLALLAPTLLGYRRRKHSSYTGNRDGNGSTNTSASISISRKGRWSSSRPGER